MGRRIYAVMSVLLHLSVCVPESDRLHLGAIFEVFFYSCCICVTTKHMC